MLIIGPFVVHSAPSYCIPARTARSAQRPWHSTDADEAVQHPLAPRMLELDLELVAFDLGDGAVAELGVEDALAERDVAAAGVAEAYRRGFDLHDPRGGAFEAAGHRSSPAGAAGLASRDVG